MGGELSLAEGRHLVALARRAAEEYAESGVKIRPESEDGIFGKARGVFVTWETYPARDLRGCIGYPLPIKPLAQAVIDNAINASSGDPRFEQVAKGEFETLVVEVSVLSVPETIRVKNPDDYAKQIKVGRDGLIITYGYASGLLLPQVPVEWNWDEREFLSQICHKAGLPSDAWRSPSAKLEKFRAQVFSEESPGGKINGKKLVR